MRKRKRRRIRADVVDADVVVIVSERRRTEESVDGPHHQRVAAVPQGCLGVEPRRLTIGGSEDLRREGISREGQRARGRVGGAVGRRRVPIAADPHRIEVGARCARRRLVGDQYPHVERRAARVVEDRGIARARGNRRPQRDPVERQERIVGGYRRRTGPRRCRGAKRDYPNGPSPHCSPLHRSHRPSPRCVGSCRVTDIVPARITQTAWPCEL